MSPHPAMIRFPGEAEPASTPIAWEAWTPRREVVRFGGEARPAEVPIAWHRAGAADTPEGLDGAAPHHGRARRDEEVHGATAASAPSRSVPLPPPPTELVQALARTQEATARAHQAFLASQERHLQTLATTSRTLAKLVERSMAG